MTGSLAGRQILSIIVALSAQTLSVGTYNASKSEILALRTMLKSLESANGIRCVCKPSFFKAASTTSIWYKELASAEQ